VKEDARKNSELVRYGQLLNFSIFKRNNDMIARMQNPIDAEKIENILSAQVVDAAIEVHRSLGGPGLLESLYEEALAHELKLRNISVWPQVLIPVTYKNIILLRTTET
jgi:hypothetical protein